MLAPIVGVNDEYTNNCFKPNSLPFAFNGDANGWTSKWGTQFFLPTALCKMPSI